MQARQKTAVIIGAGPAGLTAALELLRHTGIRPIVIETSDQVGGISRTVNVAGYRMDIGGHRFFSKSDWVMDWWQRILPLQREVEARGEPVTISYRNQSRELNLGPDAIATGAGDRVMLVRERLSRIYFLRKFFDYPVRLNLNTVLGLGPLRCIRAAASYAKASLLPVRPELSLQDFLINRFGSELYRTFFKSYTEKVWGVPCAEISAEWGAQRIKGLSLTAAVLHALRRSVAAKPDSVAQDVHTSLVESFLYPKLGPGQLWETVADLVRTEGGQIRLMQTAERLTLEEDHVRDVVVRDVATGLTETIATDYVISTMPVKDLVACFAPAAPHDVARIAQQLPYRDFITVGVIARRMQCGPGSRTKPGATILPDNWIYIQEPDVRLGRVQIFNNWSPALVPEADRVSLGLEYFCTQDDGLWRLPDVDMQALAIRELAHIGLVDPADVVAATVIRVPKAYPAYFGSYGEFATVRAHVDRIANLFLIGRNGMHRYNNQDHSMLTAKAAVDLIAAGSLDKSAIWNVNVDDDYHEQRDVDRG